ncbi:hypothetical protein DP107_03565 [Haloglomus irregulare]|uniref:Uncharacterized protein n=1 Tax=Haloglomus irregulare TaxID=2234134 RepID=A0A554NGX9_9EURY|nr:hypothetical protein [Haloglomus irregulare]TSD16240.1 hypothetical protein DP107_03565 [Haloglomus irregulare]
MESIVPEGEETVVSFMLQSLVQEQSHSGFSSVGAPSTTRWRRSSISCISSRVPVVVRQRLVHIGHGEAFVSEVRLLGALVRFAETFHTWRLFTEEQLELDLDMLLPVTQPVDDFGGTCDSASIDEAACRAVFASISGYLDALEAVREGVAAHYDWEVDPYPGPEAVAEEQAAELAETIEVPLT